MMLAHFFLPYIIILSRAAWSIQQNLEGADVLSSAVSRSDLSGYPLASGWDPGTSVNVIIGLLAFACIFGVPLILFAGYAVGKRFGFLAAFMVLLFPGILSIIGIRPTIAFASENFTIGGVGVTGDIWGMFSLIALTVVTGWTVAILAADSLRARNKFWDIYDHFWIVFGLITAIIFIADSQMTKHETDYRNTGSDAQRASAYLLKQVEAYNSQCSHTLLSSSVSCQWTSDVHSILLRISFEDPKLLTTFGPKSSAELYKHYGQYGESATSTEMDAIRIEVEAYNQRICPVTTISNKNKRMSNLSPQCQSTPAQFCAAYPDPLQGTVDNSVSLRPVALASECVIPTLIMLRKAAEKLDMQLDHDRRNRNYRWMYFLFFSVVLGGKLAGTTTKLASFDARPNSDTRRVFRLIRRVAGSGWSVIRRIGVAGIKYLRETLIRP